MGKTPKKAAPGGDERVLYSRRLKATTAPSNSSETYLHKRQRESAILNRSEVTNLKKISAGQRKNINFGSKKQIGRPPGSFKHKKVPVLEKSEESTSANMQPESEETEMKLDASIQKEDSDKEVSKDNQESEKEHVRDASPESVSTSKAEEEPLNKEIEKESEYQEKPASNSDKTKNADEHEENLHFEKEDSTMKRNEETADDKDSELESSEKCFTEDTTKDNVHEKEESVLSESQTDTESYSADIQDVTTSEVSEASETTSQNEIQKEKRAESVNKDVTSVSYDSSIMLKDVQIKLNDCLKENSKSHDSNNSDFNTLDQQTKDISFGKTLRSITGRRSLNRMRHVTLREEFRIPEYSPSDSMLVNTSSASLPPDDTSDMKVLRYSTSMPDTLSTTNGSPTDRKRKYETEDWNLNSKKQKAEYENSGFNSISLFKGLRRPIQVSTPVSELKFQAGKLDLDESSKSNEGSKKWCVIM